MQAVKAEKKASVLSQHHVLIDDVDRRFLTNADHVDPDEAELIVIWAHDGNVAQGQAAESMAHRITPKRKRVDVFPNALAAKDGTARWIRPDEPWLPTGVDEHHDFRFIRSIVDWALELFPGVDIVFAGYAAGAGFYMCWATCEEHLPFDGVALVKNALLEEEINDAGEWDVMSLALPRLFYWYSAGDPKVDTDPPKTHYEDTAAAFVHVYNLDVSHPEVSRFVCGEHPVTVSEYDVAKTDSYQAEVAIYAEESRTHAWLNCIDEHIDRFFRRGSSVRRS